MFQLSLTSSSLNAETHVYRDKPCYNSVLSHSGEYYYIVFPESNEILEVDVSTMIETRSFSTFRPYDIAISPDDLFIYTDSTDISLLPNSNFVKINLTNEEMDTLSLDGTIQHFCIDSTGNFAWVIHSTYPVPGESFDEMEAFTDYRNTGILTKINLTSFSIVCSTTTVFPLPIAIWYSDYSNRLYVHSELSENIIENNVESSMVMVYNSDLSQTDYCAYANYHAIGDRLTIGTSWTDDKRYYVVPNMHPLLPFTLRMFDTTTVPIPQDYVIVDPIDSEVNLELTSINKVKLEDTIWAIGQSGNMDLYPNRTKYIFKIDIVSLDYEMFEIPDLPNASFIRYFEISNDGRTLYIPVAEENGGSVIVISPGNHNPVCQCRIVTPMPYRGPSPAAIEFDTSGTFDEDGDDLTYHWDFDGDCIFDEPYDDSYTGDPDNPTHEYTQSGEYTVNLSVTDNYQGECETSVLTSVRII